MRKFFLSFILIFILAVSFLVPVHNVLAEARADIRTVSATQKLTHNYSYVVCPGSVATAKPSFFERLLAAVGIARALPAQKLAEGSADCNVWGIVKKVTDSSWSCSPVVSQSFEFGAPVICLNEKAKSSETSNFSPKYVESYGITSCTQTHTYTHNYTNNNGFFTSQVPVGTITRSCAGPRALPPTTTKVTYPPTVDASGIGSYSGSSLISANMRDSFSATESLQSLLTALPLGGTESGTTYSVPISVALSQMVFNAKTNTFDYVPVSCTSITVAGRALNKYCGTTISVPIGTSVYVTPKAPVPYYTYSVFVNGAITEK